MFTATHGRSLHDRTYWVWLAMNQRCRNPNNKSYHNYGGRGIKVCSRWQGPGGFINFIGDMGDPKPGETLDRINNDGHYSPSNCRWTDRKTQAANSRVSTSVTWNGKTQSISDWARELGVRTGTLAARLRRGWSVEDAITAEYRGHITIDGAKYNLSDVLVKHGVTHGAYRNRVHRGWSRLSAATTPVKSRTRIGD